MASARLARTLAIISGVIAIAQWVIFIPLLAMGSVDADNVYLWLLTAAFFGWPLAGVAAFMAAGLVERRPRAAAALLVLVGAGVLYPFFVGGVIALVAAVLAFRSRTSLATQPGSWIKMKDVSRAFAIGIAGVVMVALIIPTIISIVIFIQRDDDGGSSAAQPALTTFAQPDQALRSYAQEWRPPFHETCGGAGMKGSCIESIERSGTTATYVLCTVDHNECLTVLVTQKEDVWAVTEVDERGPKP